MATDVRVIEDTGTVVTNNTTRWPAYAGSTGKADLLRDLLDAQGQCGTGAVAIQNILMRLSNTDSSSAFDTDKASRIQ